MRNNIEPTEIGLFSYQDHVDRINAVKNQLSWLNDVIDWERFRRIVLRAFTKKRKSNAGRKSFDEILMFKILILQSLHGLSDEQTEVAVMDRFSWQSFLGLHVGCRFPDKNTIWDFRQALISADIFTQCFEELHIVIAEQGYRLESGKIVDASLVPVPIQRNTPEENAQIKQGDIPDDWGNDQNKYKIRQKDVDARWVKKGNQNYYGYKNHIKIDQKTKLIESCVATPANVHDSQVLFDLLTDQDTILYADSAYRGDEINQRLREMNIKDWSNRRAYRGTELTESEVKSNRTKSRIRSRVEHVFGNIVTSLGGKALRYIGFERNASMIIFKNFIYNARRVHVLA